MANDPLTPPHATSGVFTSLDGKTVEIRDVWAANLDQEMEIIRELIDKYHYVAMVRRLFSLNFPCSGLNFSPQLRPPSHSPSTLLWLLLALFPVLSCGEVQWH